MHRMYLERPEDAHALRRRVISDDLLEKMLANQGKQLQIGLLQREVRRRVVNLDEIQSLLQNALPGANISQTTLPYALIKDQAEWIATKDVIIAPLTQGRQILFSCVMTLMQKETKGPSDDYPVVWHPHRGFDIASYLKSRIGRHSDSLGNRITYETHGMQWMSIGPGVYHAEG